MTAEPEDLSFYLPASHVTDGPIKPKIGLGVKKGARVGQSAWWMSRWTDDLENRNRASRVRHRRGKGEFCLTCGNISVDVTDLQKVARAGVVVTVRAEDKLTLTTRRVGRRHRTAGVGVRGPGVPG